MIFDRNAYGWVEVCGIILSLTFVICMLFGEYRKTRLNKLFVSILLCNTIVLLGEVIEWVFNGSGNWYSSFILNMAHILIFIFCYIFAALFTDYLITYIGTKTTISRRIVHIMWGWCFVELILYAIAYINNMYCYFDENNFCNIAEYFWVSQAVGTVCLIVNGAIIIRHWKTLGSRDSLFLLSFVIAPFVAVFLQLFTEIAVLAISVTFSIIIIYIGIQSDLSRRLKQQETELLETRIDVMLSQIQPHFLFNSLEAIQDLCEQEYAAQSENAVKEFSKYLRGNLDSLAYKRPIAFAKELDHTRTYLSLEQKRFEERLEVVFDIQTTSFRIPALTLQPIVENAVRHGVTKRDEGGVITIRTIEESGRYVITVEDNGIGFSPDAPMQDGKNHIGIESVRYRLEAMCGGTMEISSTPGVGTAVILSIPKGGEEE